MPEITSVSPPISLLPMEALASPTAGPPRVPARPRREGGRPGVVAWDADDEDEDYDDEAGLEEDEDDFEDDDLFEDEDDLGEDEEDDLVDDDEFEDDEDDDDYE